MKENKGQFKKGYIPWNKGKNWSKEMKDKLSNSHIGKMKGSLNPRWKGNNVSYSGLHIWIKNMLGKPIGCVINKSHLSKRFVWANISGEYKRDINDWHSLCNSCNKRDGVKMHKRFLNI